MISLDQIKGFFPPQVRDNPAHRKYMLKEYIQLQILDYLSGLSYVKKLAFIGGTSLRLIKGIDRFSEDLDFDCKDFSKEEFDEMTKDVLSFLHRIGMSAEVREKKGAALKAFRSNLVFPGLLFDLNLSGHRSERFLIKLECQDQLVNYENKIVNVKGCGLFFPFPVPPDPVLCSMKISALLSRAKGRDFYDVMFLMGQTEPDYDFLAARCGIRTKKDLKDRLSEMLDKVDLVNKSRDFEHLLFDNNNSRRILHFREYVKEL